MLISFRSFLTAITVLVLGVSGAHVSSARADAVFHWHDAHTKLSVAYPDTWRMVHDQKPDDILTIMAPSDGAFPMCRVRVREDRRSVIYPQRYSTNIQHVNYSRDFWEGYVGEFAAANLGEVGDDAALGRGFGSYANMSFISDSGPRMQRRGIAFVSLYRDNAYIFECSAQASLYEQWHDEFLRIASSINFRKEIHELPGGHYRHFVADPMIVSRGPTPAESVYY